MEPLYLIHHHQLLLRLLRRFSVAHWRLYRLAKMVWIGEDNLTFVNNRVRKLFLVFFLGQKLLVSMVDDGLAQNLIDSRSLLDVD